MTFQIRTPGDPLELLPSIRSTIHDVDPRVAIFDAGTLAERVDRMVATESLIARLASLFGGVALLLTSIGLFGVLSYSVARRTKEFGVRLSLGARPIQVTGLVMRDGLLFVIAGAAIGVASALFVFRYIAGLLFGLVPRNPGVILVSIAVIAVVAVIASLAPAHRASRVVPSDALRYE
jgi:ABC-type antimicrobial peptide transport system permease subunit